MVELEASVRQAPVDGVRLDRGAGRPSGRPREMHLQRAPKQVPADEGSSSSSIS